MNLKKVIRDFVLRPSFEVFKLDRYSKPSRYNLEKKLEKYLDFDNGIFLEIGANDGFKQSNTYYLEKIRNWKGILIEPVPELFKHCKKKRKNSEVFNYICSAPRDSRTFKKIRYAGLMSVISGSLEDEKNENSHVRRGLMFEKLDKTYETSIECLTISQVIDKSKYNEFDFMSIDVEGHELQVLQGLDLTRHAPKYLLVEIWDHTKNEIIEYLTPQYTIVEYISDNDILFEKS